MKSVTIHNVCRICGNTRLTPVLDLGAQPPANSFLKRSELGRKEPRFPLSVQFCTECSLLSLRHVVDPRVLFKNYHYETGASAPLVLHFQEEAQMLKDRYTLGAKDFVVEFGSNDGILLSELLGTCRVLGVDPAKNLSLQAEKRGVKTLTAFFGENTAERIRSANGAARVIVANNVFAHIHNIHDVMRGVALLLTEDGVFVSESHWVGNLIHEGGFDQIYHEHLSYYSLHALHALAKAHKLVITDVEVVPIHGASLRVCMQRQGKPSTSVSRLLAREKKLGLTTKGVFQDFGKKVKKNRADVRAVLFRLKRKHKRVAGYGAPAKGNTLLNYFNIGHETLDFITDTTPAKQGLYTPGTHIPVVSPEILASHPPDYFLLLAWNYASAILEKEAPLRK